MASDASVALPAETPLVHAARQGDVDTVRFLLEHGVDPSPASDLGPTALHHAAGLGNIELIKLLLSKGAAVDSQSDSGTPLVWAARHGKAYAVEVLLDNQANVDANVNISARGATLLHIAADCDSSDILNYLLEAGADPNITDEDGLKPIQVAAARGNRKGVEILFPLTTPVQSIRNWSLDGIINQALPESGLDLEKTRIRLSGLPRDLRRSICLKLPILVVYMLGRRSEEFRGLWFNLDVIQLIDYPTQPDFSRNVKQMICALKNKEVEDGCVGCKLQRFTFKIRRETLEGYDRSSPEPGNMIKNCLEYCITRGAVVLDFSSELMEGRLMQNEYPISHICPSVCLLLLHGFRVAPLGFKWGPTAHLKELRLFDCVINHPTLRDAIRLSPHLSLLLMHFVDYIGGFKMKVNLGSLKFVRVSHMRMGGTLVLSGSHIEKIVVIGSSVSFGNDKIEISDGLVDLIEGIHITALFRIKTTKGRRNFVAFEDDDVCTLNAVSPGMMKMTTDTAGSDGQFKG